MDHAYSSTLVLTPIVLMAPRQDGIEVVWGISRPAKAKVEWKEKTGDQSGMNATSLAR